jgi:hypothetical protein
MHPSEDPFVQNIKRIADRGGERGPRFDRGVLETIAALENDGELPRNNFVSCFVLLKMQKATGQKLLTEEEADGPSRFMKARGWTFDEAFEYVEGVDFVERMLWVYKDRVSNK